MRKNVLLPDLSFFFQQKFHLSQTDFSKTVGAPQKESKKMKKMK